MSYVTQGTVQVGIKTVRVKHGKKFKVENNIEIQINPAQEYTVKHNKNDYIIFIDTGPVLKAIVFKKTQSFTTKNLGFIQYLTNAAFKSTKIEIEIRDPRSGSAPTKIEIESLKIPAPLEQT